MSFSPPFASVFRRRVAPSLALLFFAATPFFAFAQNAVPVPPPAPPKPAPKRPASVDWALDVAKFLTSSPAPPKPVPPTPPNAPRPDVPSPPTPPQPTKPAQVKPKTLPRPESAALIARAASLRRFEDDLATFFQQTSDVAFRPLTAMRATPFGGAVKALDLDAPAGLFLFFDAESPRAQVAVV
ncbi:MAG: hypothetical protein IKW13_03940, partial [Thermoguttaceae bacterium]|nr:hypothetical protein [Thermoguttaceae bacterium]